MKAGRQRASPSVLSLMGRLPGAALRVVGVSGMGDGVGRCGMVLSASGTVVKAESRRARLAPSLRSGLAGRSGPRSQEGGVDPESDLSLP